MVMMRYTASTGCALRTIKLNSCAKRVSLTLITLKFKFINSVYASRFAMNQGFSVLENIYLSYGLRPQGSTYQM
ncbi:86047e56-041a-459b-86a1-dc29e8f669e0 [Sclerotinia trifoliorum]|uniref:86047e56-041a-459b-86a1-dc29e8f669e0 n=1 Tax=Sclerotinia trifoliorum TaxID=28548 RepID=A0A8H2VW21_9HELO|nr:86047e56-041a-459b-86a1-dc29e8f669e0 [Sclerotinia trifoliorum]